MNPSVTMQRAVVGAILYTDAGELLLQQRDDKPGLPYPGAWTLFGGAVEFGETPVQALERELFEELELRQPMTFWHDYICPIRSKPGGITVRNYVFTGRLMVPPAELVLHEGQAMRLFSPREALKLDLAYGQTPLLNRWLGAGLNGGCCTI